MKGAVGLVQTYLDIAKQALRRHIGQVRESRPERYVFNELNEFNGNDSDEERCLITRLQAGQTWLLDQHHKWLAGDLTAGSDAEFSRVWNRWWELDQLLRTDYEFQGCVYGDLGTCPEGFPCQGCADLPAPAVVAQLALA